MNSNLQKSADGSFPVGKVVPLIGLWSFVFVGLIALGYLTFRQARSLDEQNNAASTEIRAGRLAQSAGTGIEKIDGIVDRAMNQYLLYRSGRLNEADFDKEIRRLESAFTSPLGIRFADKSGAVYTGSAAERTAGFSIARQSYFLALRNGGVSDPFISHAIYSKISKQWLFILAKRINGKAGEFEGVAYTAIPISDILKTESGDTARTVELRDAQLVLLGALGRPDGGDPTVENENVSSALAQFSAAIQSGAVSTFNAGAHVVAVRRIPRFSLFVDVAGPQSGSIGGLLRAGMTLQAGLLTVLMACVLLGAKQLYRLIRSLAGQMREMADSEKVFRQLFDGAPLGMEVSSIDGTIVRVNKSFCDLIGYPTGFLMGKSVLDITAPEDIHKDKHLSEVVLRNSKKPALIEKQYIHKTGELIWVQKTAVFVRDTDGAPQYVIAQIEDISQRKEQHKHVRDMAYYDPLTKLPNRRMLMEQLGLIVKQAKWNDTLVALMFIDLDGFKKINDTLGHDFGDELLKVAAQRLVACVRSEDLVARQGGDEFVIVLKEITNADNARLVAGKIVDRMKLPINLKKKALSVSASVGVAIFEPDSTISVETLIKQADTAMYLTKQAGRNGFTMFDPQTAPNVLVSRNSDAKSEENSQDGSRLASTSLDESLHV